MSKASALPVEFALLALLALLWGSSYMFLKVAVAEIPPVTLIALRVAGAAAFLMLVMSARKERLPRDGKTWRMLFVQAFLNSIGAWTVLAWGQQFVDAGLASVLNSTSPIFVVLLGAFAPGAETFRGLKPLGCLIGLSGVVLIVGIGALDRLGAQVAGQLACLIGALLYAGAAINGERFGHMSAVSAAAGTMICASVVLVPAAMMIDAPWTLAPSARAIGATLVLSILCTGVALLIYFRLARTLGPMGVSSQSYLRAGVGVVLGLIFLGESLSAPVAIGLGAALAGVVMINWPARVEAQSCSAGVSQRRKGP